MDPVIVVVLFYRSGSDAARGSRGKEHRPCTVRSRPPPLVNADGPICRSRTREELAVHATGDGIRVRQARIARLVEGHGAGERGRCGLSEPSGGGREEKNVCDGCAHGDGGEPSHERQREGGK
jgi:hypothetical protein